MLTWLSLSLVIVVLKPHSGVEEPFVFAHITDSHCGALNWTNQSIQWIQSQPLDFVVHTGDLVQDWSNQTQWNAISQIMHQLDGTQNWTVLAGNHDSASGSNFTYFANTFGNMINHVEVYGNFVFVTMSWASRNGSISPVQFEWLEVQLELYRNHKVIVAHHWLHSNPLEGHNYSSSPSTKALRNYSNIVLAVSGHNHDNDHSSNFVVSKSVGQGFVRLFSVYGNGSIHARTWSLWDNGYLKGSDDDFWL